MFTLYYFLSWFILNLIYYSNLFLYIDICDVHLLEKYIYFYISYTLFYYKIFMGCEIINLPTYVYLRHRDFIPGLIQICIKNLQNSN